MNMLNYFFIGFGFTLIIDLLLSTKIVSNHPSMKNTSWGMLERIICILIWPLAALMFFIAFIKQFFKK